MKQGLRVRRPQKWPRRPATLFPPDLSIHSRGFTELQTVFDCVRQHSRLGRRRDGRFGRPATGRPHPANQRDNRSLATHLPATDRSLAWMTHGVINHHPNIVVSNTLYALCTSTILILLWRTGEFTSGSSLFPGFSSECSWWRWMCSPDLLPSP